MIRQMIFVCLIAISFGALPFAFASGESIQVVDFIPMTAKTETLRGEARFKNGDFGYLELHTMTSRNGKLWKIETEYRGAPPSTNIIAKMKNEFLAPGYLPDYSYEDIRLKVEDHILVDRAGGKVVLRRKVGTDESEGSLILKEKMIGGQGVYFWVIANLATLLKGEKIHVRFVVPAKMEDYAFRAKLESTDEQKHTIGLVLDNWLIRLFVSKIEFDIDTKTNKLLEYRGPSNVADDRGKYRDVIIKYGSQKQHAAL